MINSLLKNNFKVLSAINYDNQDLTNYIIEKLLTGLRVITFIEYNDNDNIKVTFFTKNHEEIKLNHELEKELKNVYKASLYYGNDIVLDGKLESIENSELKQYVCFDILLAEEFFRIKQTMRYSVRYNNLKKFLSNSNIHLAFLKLIFAVPYTSEHFEKLQKEFLDTHKWNGFIFRKNSVYRSEKNFNELLKFQKN